MSDSVHIPMTVLRVPGRVLVGCAFAFLALPNILFFLGWLQPWVAVPLSIGLLVSGVRAFYWNCGSLDFSVKDLYKLLGVFLFVLLYQFEVGYTAHTYQHWDFHTRNAFYGNLIDYAWPIVLPDGREMTYCLAGWLPLAFLCKILVCLGVDCHDLTRVPGYLLLCWNTGIMLLVVMLGWLVLQRVSVVFVLIIFGLGGAESIFTRLPLLKQVWEWCSTSVPTYYFGSEQMICTINILPISYLAVLLLLLKSVPWWSYFLTGALLLLIAPMNALALFPMMIFAVVRSCVVPGGFAWRERLREAWGILLALAIVCVSVMYYARADDGGMPTMLAMQRISSLQDYVKLSIPLIFTILLLGYIPWRYLREGRGWFWLACVLAVLLPCLYVGNLNNEFLMKASPMVMCLFAVLWSRGMLDAPQRARRDIFVWVCVGFCAVRLGGFFWMHHQKIWPHRFDWMYNECNPYQGHLFHPGMALDQSIPATHEPFVHGVFYARAGESEGFFFRMIPTPTSRKYEELRYKQSRNYRLDVPYGSVTEDSQQGSSAE